MSNKTAQKFSFTSGWLISLCTALVLAMFALSGCSAQPASKEAQSTAAPTAQSSEVVELRLQAAASLKYAFNDIIPLWEKKHPNVKIAANFGASGTLAEQIKQGAPADVFISANQAKMNDLEKEAKVAPHTRSDLLENELVLITPMDSKLGISQLSDLTKENCKFVAVGEPSAVPAGKYAEQTFKSAGIADALKSKSILCKDVTQVLETVASQNADAGLVYKTDALTKKDKVKIVTAVDGHDKVVYPAAQIADSKHMDLGAEFLTFLKSEEVGKIFEKYGFKPVK